MKFIRQKDKIKRIMPMSYRIIQLVIVSVERMVCSNE